MMPMVWRLLLSFAVSALLFCDMQGICIRGTEELWQNIGFCCTIALKQLSRLQSEALFALSSRAIAAVKPTSGKR